MNDDSILFGSAGLRSSLWPAWFMRSSWLSCASPTWSVMWPHTDCRCSTTRRSSRISMAPVYSSCCTSFVSCCRVSRATRDQPSKSDKFHLHLFILRVTQLQLFSLLHPQRALAAMAATAAASRNLNPRKRNRRKRRMQIQPIRRTRKALRTLEKLEKAPHTRWDMKRYQMYWCRSIKMGRV